MASEFVLIDVEAAVGEVLRAAVSAPVYGQLPADPPFPCVRVQRVGGAPVSSRPLYLDAALIQIDVFADSKGQARSIADVARATIAGLANTQTSFGWLTGARVGALNYAPDEAFAKPKARYRFDFTTWARVATPA